MNVTCLRALRYGCLLWGCMWISLSSHAQPGSSLSPGGGPEEVSRNYVEACTKMMRGDHQGALALFQEVVNSDPNNHAAHYNIARLSLELRNYDQAILQAQTAIRLNPGNYWYYQVLEKAYEYQGNFGQAIQTLEQVRERFPERTEDRLYLSELYGREGQTKAALQELEQLEIELGPNTEIALRKYRLLLNANEIEKALALTEQLLELAPDRAQFYHMRYETLQRLGQVDAGVAVLESLLERQPDDGYALLALADYYKARDELERSDEYLFRAFENPDVDPEGKVALIRKLLPYLSQEPEIGPRITRLMRLYSETHPGTASAFALRGKMFALEQNPDSARKQLRASLALDPTDISVWLDLIETSRYQQDYQQLNRDAEEALEYYPKPEQFLYYYGSSSAKLADYGTAVYALEKIKKIRPDDPTLMARTLDQLGQVYQAQSKWELADTQFQEALRLQPESPFVLEHYGDFLFQQGKKEAARKYWQQAIEAGAAFDLNAKMAEQ